MLFVGCLAFPRHPQDSYHTCYYLLRSYNQTAPKAVLDYFVCYQIRILSIYRTLFLQKVQHILNYFLFSNKNIHLECKIISPLGNFLYLKNALRPLAAHFVRFWVSLNI